MMEVLLHVFCGTLPARLLAYAPFLDRLRFGKRGAAATLTVSLLLELLLVSAVLQSGRPEWVRGAEFLFAPVGVAACWLNIRMAPTKQLFACLLVIDYMMIVAGTASHVAVNVLNAGARSWQSSALCAVLYAVTWPTVYRLHRSAARQIYQIDAPQLWRVIWLAPALTTATALIFTGSLREEQVGNWRFLFTRIGLLVCTMVIYWILVQALAGLQKQAALEEQLRFEAHLLEMQISQQKKQNHLMVEHMDELRRQRHDLRHQLTAIQGLAGEENPRLRAYIDEVLRAIPASPRSYCENQAVNAIVSHYTALCRERGVEAEVQLAVPARTEQVTDAELCVIFGNLMENALEACGRMTEGRRFLRLNSTVHLGTLTITLDNSFDGRVTRENGRYRSSKRDDFGVGLSSIQAVARKREGDARFEADGRVFRSSVYLRI